MRIERLDLIAYGPFTDKSLHLSEGASGLHIIYGDNEAGKSTSLRALIAWLFGIPTRTGDNYIHANPQLRIGGKLSLRSGQALEFIRRKGMKGTLLAPLSDAALDDSVLKPFLPGGLDESLFTKLYGIDYDRLVSGGKELLNQSGDLGQALFSAAVGTESLRKIWSELQTDVEALFKPRASTKLVNQAISGFKEAKKRIKDASLPVVEWKKLQKEFKETLSKIRQSEKALTVKSRDKSRLERLARTRGAMAERRAVMNKIDNLGEVLLLPEDFDEKWKTTIATFQNAIESKARAQAKLSRLNKESNGLNVQNGLLENEDVILSLHKELGAAEKTIKDRPQQDGKRRLLRNEAEQLLKGLRPDLGLDKADQLRVLTNNKKWISDLVRKHGLLNQRHAKAGATLRDIEDERQAIKKELGKQTLSKLDLNELKAVVAAARKPGDLETRLSDLQKGASDERQTCNRELSRLGRFAGTLEALAHAAIPVSETLDIFEKQFDAVSEKIKDCERRQNEIKEAHQKAQQDLSALLLTADVPTLADLDQARLERDHGWKLIKQKYIQGGDVEKDIATFAAGNDLTVLYEQKRDSADQVSDRLRLSADQVAKRAGLEAGIENLETRLAETAAKQKRNQQLKRAYESNWLSTWEPLKINPGTPREMKQWLLKKDKLLSNVDSVNKIYGDAQKLEKELVALKQSISSEIQKFDASIKLEEMRLEAMINLCEQKIDQAEADLGRKRQLENSLVDTEIRIKRTREEITETENDLDNWSNQWRQAIDGLGLTPDAHPEQATEAFDKLLLFFEKFDKSEGLRRRIYGMDQVKTDFTKRVSEFADRIGFNKDGLDAYAIAAQFNRALNEAREAKASQKRIEASIKELQTDIENAEIAIGAAQKQLNRMKSQADVTTDKELMSAAEKSQEKRTLMQKLDTLELELTRNGDGLSIDELEIEASRSDIDGIDGELEKVSKELHALQKQRDGLRDLRQTLQNEINAKDGSAAAAKASEDAEEQLATLISGVEQYLRLQIAALILEQQIEEYRKKNQAPVLARAGELFSKLTLGSYVTLRDELDNNNKPVLRGVRPNDMEVPVEGMSEGTRDQLYLSLRLATLEHHLSNGEPTPFVVDDILIGFDDNRTKACLEVLGELSLKTQVLLFTHHRRVLELSRKINATAGIYHHALV